jgi:NAD(P)-dependent dehydrogenase (short-subunit alcohol dehydrogenase family)
MNKVCLVVGAGPGIGQALGFAFAHLGYDIALLARNPGKLADACVLIKKKTGREVRAYSGDVADEKSLKAAIARVRRGLGDIEVMIYNAAVATRGKPTTLAIEQLMDEFRVNVAGALVAARDVAKHMKIHQRGTILFTGGSFAYEPAADYASLSLGKAALRNLTYSLAQELGASGIHVATVTVHGYVQPGTQFDPHRIAQAFVSLHKQPKGRFEIEMAYK